MHPKRTPSTETKTMHPQDSHPPSTYTVRRDFQTFPCSDTHNFATCICLEFTMTYIFLISPQLKLLVSESFHISCTLITSLLSFLQNSHYALWRKISWILNIFSTDFIFLFIQKTLPAVNTEFVSFLNSLGWCAMYSSI